MADSQEVKAIVEGVVAKVFDKRISELRKDLHRGVGDSLNSRVSELQLDVETGIADVFNARVKEINTQISKNVSDVLNHQVTDFRRINGSPPILPNGCGKPTLSRTVVLPLPASPIIRNHGTR